MKNIRKLLLSSIITLFIAATAWLPLGLTAYAAPTYDCGDYGANAYSDNCPEDGGDQGGGGSSDGGGQAGDGGLLSDTGQRIAVYSILSVACVGGAIYLITRVRRSHQEKAQ